MYFFKKPIFCYNLITLKYHVSNICQIVGTYFIVIINKKNQLNNNSLWKLVRNISEQLCHGATGPSGFS